MNATGAPPILSATPDPHGCLSVWCAYCKTRHYHGRGTGHRAAHCTNQQSPYLRTGYRLEEVKQCTRPQ